VSDDESIDIDGHVQLPRRELSYRASRSGGPGGQHVNTSSTRVQLIWNIPGSPSLAEDQKARLLERLSNRIDSEGNLRLTASGSRSQARNKEEVTERFRQVVAAALREQQPRKRTRPPRSAAEARLREKRRRAKLKETRRPPLDPE
jgi:ribosome-associated protein